VVTGVGVLQEVVAGADTSTYVWEMNRPIEVPLLSIDQTVAFNAQGPGGLPIAYNLPAHFGAGIREKFDVVPDVVGYLIGVFGPFPFDTLGFTWVSQMAYPGEAEATRIFMDTFLETIIVHEVAHQWFGCSVNSATSADYWLAEGFATYAEMLWVEHTGGPLDERVRSKYRLLGAETVPLARPGAENVIIDAVYDRGAVTLHALRLRVGDDVFFDILRTYYDRFRYASATTADFIAVAEEVSGEELGEFFDAWLYQETVPPIPELGLRAAP
jgi:predicted metalloprotease with PDZ domain